MADSVNTINFDTQLRTTPPLTPAGTAWVEGMQRSGAQRLCPRGRELYYATYWAPDGQPQYGTMELVSTPRGPCWIFIPEDGGEPSFPAFSQLDQHGHVATADAQQADDCARHRGRD